MLPKKPAILIIGCFDTKAAVFAQLREQIISFGEQVYCINSGIMGTTDVFPVDMEAGYLAEKGGVSLKELREKKDRGRALEVMAKGLSQVLKTMDEKGLVNAAIGMGGGGGTYLALSAMQLLPLGLPKICISTLATKDVSHLVGLKDIVLIPSVVDVAGLNNIILPIINQAAAAIVAMSRVEKEKTHQNKRSIAISMFGNTTDCVNECTNLLQAKGYEVMAFHANGSGGKAMETLIREGCFDGVMDLTTTEMADEYCGGILSAGPERLSAAVEMNLPLVVAPGCLDMVNFGSPEKVPEKYKDRHFYQWAPDVTLMRTNEEETSAIGKIMADKLNLIKDKNKAAIIIPSLGFSQLDAPGNPFYNHQCVKAFEAVMEKHLDLNVGRIPIEANINDTEFAKAAVDVLLGMMEKD